MAAKRPPKGPAKPPAKRPAWDRAADLRRDYELLSELLASAEGSGAAAIVRERRLIAAELERLETPTEVPLVDELAAKRSTAGAGRPPARRRKSG